MSDNFHKKDIDEGIMSLRRTSRSSSHSSQIDHKLEASYNERATRSRASSEDLVLLELPRYVRTKRTSHPNTVAESTNPVKNGKDEAVTEGEIPRRSLRSADHRALNDKDSVVDHFGGGDANVSGRSRRRSGRITSNQDNPEQPSILPQDSQTECRSLRRRTRSTTVMDGIGNGPSDRSKDNEADDNLPPDSHDDETRNVHESSLALTTDSSILDTRKGDAAGSLSNKQSNKKQIIPESTSVHKEQLPLKSQVGSETAEQTETASTTDHSERLLRGKEKVSKLELTSSEKLLSRTSPRRTRHSSVQSTEPKDTLWNDKGEVSEPATDSNLQPRNNVQESKTTPRKRTRSISTSVSPRKHPDNQEESAPAPSSPKKRKTGSICRDLCQDFNATNPSSTEIVPSSSQSECNNEKTAELQDSRQSLEKAQGVTVSEKVDRGTVEGVSQEPSATVPEAVRPRSRRRSGASPGSTPQKQFQLDLTKSPTRRGLRSSGSMFETPMELIPPQPETTPDKETQSNSGETAVTPSASLATTPKKSSSKKKPHKKDAVREKGTPKEAKGEGNRDSQLNREDVDYQADEWYEDIDDGEPFYFESDHMAIKGNKDYRMLLRTLTTLEAQRKQAIQDLDHLLEYRDKALKNPIKFVHKLQHKDTLKLPHCQRVVKCPNVDWERYVGPPETNELLGLVGQPRNMRPAKSASVATHTQVGCGPCTTSQNKPVPMAPSANLASGIPVSQDPDVPSTSTSSTPDPVRNTNIADCKHDCKDVKKKFGEGNKLATFNQLWTREEQRRLEEFLVRFPMEEVEARRWEKIAKALGNRTAQQVASRVQKYFIKLMKAGLPVPGRLPNLSTYQNYRKTSKRMHPFTKPLYQPSTFLQSIQPPVYMTEDDSYNALHDGFDDDDDELISDDETIPEEMRNHPEYHELMRLKMFKKSKVRQQGHAGFSCDGCNMEPIVGIRWHCTECTEPVSTDLCQTCVNRNFSSKHHSSTHQMEPVYASFNQSYVDGDYTSFEPILGDYNYLDPNYNPMQAT